MIYEDKQFFKEKSEFKELKRNSVSRCQNLHTAISVGIYDKLYIIFKDMCLKWMIK